MSSKLIKTINGVKLPVTECRKFENGWYKIGDINIPNSGDCYEINGRYYRIDTGLITYDYETLKYTTLSSNLILGYVDYSEEIKQYVSGYFSITSKNVIIRDTSSGTLCISAEIADKNKKYRERLKNGQYYHISSIPAFDFINISTPSDEYKTSLEYDSENCMSKYIENYDNLEIEISENVKKFSKFLNGLSFGFEFETSAGNLPYHILPKTCLIPLRDGSIKGLEYVTVPLSEDKGIQALINSVNILKERTLYDNTCSLHLHIGNVPRTKEFILAFLKITCALQDEIYEMFPLYKKYNFRVKNKNYSKPYNTYELMSQMDRVINKSNIDFNFDILYKHLSCGERLGTLPLSEVVTHPNNRNNRAKWNVGTRYYIHNLIPLIFGNKKTIEFRIHTPTFDISKIMNFLFINSSLINFVKQNEKMILQEPKFLCGLSLMTVVDNGIYNIDTDREYSILNKEISTYISNRKNFSYNQKSDGDIVGNELNLPSGDRIDWNYKKNININKYINDDKDIYDNGDINQNLIQSLSQSITTGFINNGGNVSYYHADSSLLFSPPSDHTNTNSNPRFTAYLDTLSSTESHSSIEDVLTTAGREFQNEF